MKIKEICNQGLGIFKTLRKRISIFGLLSGFLVCVILIFLMIQTRTTKKWIKCEVKISSESWFWKSEEVPQWLGESIKNGDKDFDPFGKKVAEVLAVKEYELSSIDTQQGAKKEVYLTLNLKVSKNRRTGKIKYKDQPLEIGAPIELHLTNTYVPGLVTFIEGSGEDIKEKEIVIDGVSLNNFPWNAEAIPVGGEMKDGSGKVIAKILSKKVEIAKKTAETAWGELVVSNDPLKRDIYLSVKLRVTERQNNFYFLFDKKVKIGENIFIQIPGIDIKWFSIRKIYDADGKQIY